MYYLLVLELNNDLFATEYCLQKVHSIRGKNPPEESCTFPPSVSLYKRQNDSSNVLHYKPTYMQPSCELYPFA